MRKIIILLIFFCMTLPAIGAVSTRACLSDGNTPFPPDDTNFPHIYPDIMVGTKLTIIVWSDVNEYWEDGGALALEEADMNTIGLLYGRGFDGFEYPNSCLPDAGAFPAVYDSYMYPGPGFEIYGGEEPNAGDWFIFDYNALDIGDCNITFYDGLGDLEPAHTLIFHHVRTRDFNHDTMVNFLDFAVLASYWQVTDCNDPNWCEGTDLDINGSVDANDLRLFCEYWLKETK